MNGGKARLNTVYNWQAARMKNVTRLKRAICHRVCLFIIAESSENASISCNERFLQFLGQRLASFNFSIRVYVAVITLEILIKVIHFMQICVLLPFIYFEANAKARSSPTRHRPKKAHFSWLMVEVQKRQEKRAPSWLVMSVERQILN